MKTMLFKKTILAALTIALALAALPITGVSAAGTNDPLPPAQGQGDGSERVEKAWERMNRRYERLGKFFDKAGELTARAEAMIAYMKEKGESTAELEAALAAFEAAVKESHPIYESCKGIISAHKGFDADGKVTDLPQAIQTLGELGAKLAEIHEAMGGAARTLIELMKSIRDAHRPAPAPGS